MNSVGIDISKGRSTIAVMRPFGEVVISPFEVPHTDSELSELARRLKSQNIFCNPKTVLRIMKKYDLLSEIRRRRK